MRKKLQVAIVLFAIIPILICLPACSKKSTETEESKASVQEEDREDPKVTKQLEKERQEQEAKERQLRAEKIKFMDEDIYFEKDSYNLMPAAQELLQRKAQWLRKNSNIKVIIEGHTDEAGSKEYNLALGDRRAGAVKSFLIGQGVQSSRLIAVSYGNEQPIDDLSSEKARSKNRRVHFEVE